MSYNRDKWDPRYMGLARHIAIEWSKDPSTKVGAVVVNDRKQVRGTGYNGFPRGVGDHPERYADRTTKYPMVVHAEVNAVLDAGADARGATLYVWPLPPCPRCAGIIIQAGIKRVVMSTEWTRVNGGKYDGDPDPMVMEMFAEAGVEVTRV